MAVLNAPGGGGRAGALPPPPDAAADAQRAVAAAFDQEWARVVATLIRVTGDWALAEDAAQDAFVAAARRWPTDGVPDRPGGWLTTVARNSALDRLRRRRTEDRVLRSAAADPTVTQVGPDGEGDTADEPEVPSLVVDDRLRLVFTCCHPALPMEARVALTLRTVAGLEIAEIAAAFGVSEHAMAKRLVRARAKIAHARIPYRVPAAADLPERLDGVLAVLYLIFTEGYAPTTADVVRVDLCVEAERLATALADLLPDEPEALGLLALVRLHDSRRAARVDAVGTPVPLDEQDRALWDTDAVTAGLAARDAARAAATRRAAGGAVVAGAYQLQAEIAACHVDGTTDWSRIVALYDALVAMAPTPHARLARAVAVGRAAGLDAGLAALDALGASGPPGAPDSAGLPPHLVPAARADLLRRAGRRAEAAAWYRTALELVPDGPERRFLAARLDRTATG